MTKSLRGARGCPRASAETPDFSLLSARVSELREREVARDQLLASNWRKGVAQQTKLLRLPDWGRKLALSPDGERLAVGTYGGRVFLFDTQSNQSSTLVRQLDGLRSETTALAFDGDILAAGCRTGEVCRWSFSSPQQGEALVCSHDGAVTAVALAPGGAVLSACTNGVLRAFSGDEPASRLQLASPALCISTCGHYTALGLQNGRVLVYASTFAECVSNAKPILELQAHDAPVACLHLLSNSLVTGGGDGSLRGWSLATGEATLCVEKAHVAGALTCLQADENKIVSGGRDGRVQVWDVASGARRFSMQTFTEYLDGVCFSRAKLFTTGTNDSISVTDFSVPGKT